MNRNLNDIKIPSAKDAKRLYVVELVSKCTTADDIDDINNKLVRKAK